MFCWLFVFKGSYHKKWNSRRLYFDGCNLLTDITYGEKVISIKTPGVNLPSLKNLIIENGKIEEHAFCYSLVQKAWVGKNVSIKASGFGGCSELSELTVFAKNIEMASFLNCNNLSKIIFGEEIEYIGTLAFSGLPKLTEIEIPSSNVKIGSIAFEGCSQLKSIKIKGGTIGESAFRSCKNLKVVDLGNITFIGNRAFAECNIEELILPSSLEEIGSYAFYGNPFEFIKLPDNLLRIGASAFKDCSNVKYITIGKSLQSIGDEVFWGCGSISHISSYASFPPSAKYSSFPNNVYFNASLHIPVGTEELYRRIEPWKEFIKIDTDIPNAGIDDILDNKIDIKVRDGVIHIFGDDWRVKYLYDINGKLVYQGYDSTIRNLSKGIYIIKIANKSHKITI